jgi:hypothetical protein
VAHQAARILFFTLFLGLAVALLGGDSLGTPRTTEPLAWTGSARPRAQKQVFLGGNLSDEQVVTFTATVVASGHPGVVLLDSAKASAPAKDFLAAFRPDRVIPVGSFPEGITDLERRLNISPEAVLPWKRGPPTALWAMLFPRAARVVVCPPEPRPQLLQAACLAGVLHAPLYVLLGPEDAPELRQHLRRWHSTHVYAAGITARSCRGLDGVIVHRLKDTNAVAAAYLRRLARRGPIRTLVVANPADTQGDRGGMSAVAPWLALHKRAALLLTNDQGTNTEAVVTTALKNPPLRRADTLLLAASLKAIPMEQRPNPIPTDKDRLIDMEPLTPRGDQPFSFATGRLFHEDPALIPVLEARERLLQGQDGTARKAMVVSNPGGGLPLLEAFSHNTVKEFRNRGYQTSSLFGNDVNEKDVRRLLPQQDIFLWEGHHSTLIRDYCVHEWPEPLRPCLVFLQSCLALAEPKAQPFLRRGAVAVIGSSTRTYSGSGGACALAFFNALHYENQTIGESLRHAKNFLLAYSLLKQKRLGKLAKRSGANVRAAWAFSLWGDPTLRLPLPPAPRESLPVVGHEVHGRTIRVSLPETPYPKVVTSKYQIAMRPNAVIAGLLRGGDEDGKRLVPFVFAEVRLRRPHPGQVPRLHSRIPGRQWVFCWDDRRQVGYLLITPRAKDQTELHFHVKWDDRNQITR